MNMDKHIRIVESVDRVKEFILEQLFYFSWGYVLGLIIQFIYKFIF